MKQNVTTAFFRGLIVLVIFMATGAPVLAADDSVISRPYSLKYNLTSNFYLGANLGYSRYKQVEDTTTTYGLFGGYHINDVLAIDIGWTDLGDASNPETRSDSTLFQLGMTGKIPVRNDLTLFGKVGFSMWDYDLSKPIDSYSDSNTDAFIGFGADYNFDGQSAVRFGLDFYSLRPDFLTERENISEFSIGISFKP